MSEINFNPQNKILIFNQLTDNEFINFMYC